MDRTAIILELENIKDQVLTYEESVARFEQASKKIEEVKNYEPRRLAEFDAKYFPEFLESKIGKKSEPKEFASFDPRRLSKKAVANRNSEIEKYNSIISQLKRDFELQYESKRQNFKKEDDNEKKIKLQLAEEELQISKEVSESNLQKLECVNLLPKSMFSSTIIAQLIKYFADWRVDSVKEAINLYYDEIWRQEESEKLQEFFTRVEEKLTDNTNIITKVSEDTSNTLETLSELSSAVENLSIEIDLLSNKE